MVFVVAPDVEIPAIVTVPEESGPVAMTREYLHRLDQLDRKPPNFRCVTVQLEVPFSAETWENGLASYSNELAKAGNFQVHEIDLMRRMATRSWVRVGSGCLYLYLHRYSMVVKGFDEAGRRVEMTCPLHDARLYVDGMVMPRDGIVGRIRETKIDWDNLANR